MIDKNLIEQVVTTLGDAAYKQVQSMVPRADGAMRAAPVWHGWALREAFLAGAAMIAEEEIGAAIRERFKP